MPTRAGRGYVGVGVRVLLITLLVSGLIWVGAFGWGDEWRRLIETGDRLARAGSAPSQEGLTARTAYLLAFHQAQDALDVARMLATADRLERLGEPALAAHVRRAAREVAAYLPSAQ